MHPLDAFQRADDQNPATPFVKALENLCQKHGIVQLAAFFRQKDELHAVWVGDGLPHNDAGARFMRDLCAEALLASKGAINRAMMTATLESQ